MGPMGFTGPVGPQGNLGPQGPMGLGATSGYPYDVTMGDATFINVGGPAGTFIINTNGVEANGLVGTSFPNVIFSNISTSADYAIDFQNVAGASGGVHLDSNTSAVFDGPVTFNGTIIGLSGSSFTNGATGPQGPVGAQGAMGIAGPSGPASGWPVDSTLVDASIINIGTGLGSMNFGINGIDINNIQSTQPYSIVISNSTGTDGSVLFDGTNGTIVVNDNIIFNGTVVSTLYDNEAVYITDITTTGATAAVSFADLTSVTDGAIQFRNVAGALYSLDVDSSNAPVHFGANVIFSGSVTGVTGASNTLEDILTNGNAADILISLSQSGIGSIILDPSSGVTITGASANSIIQQFTPTGALNYTLSANGSNIVGFLVDDDTSITGLAYQNNGSLLTVNSSALSTARTQTFQDADGVIALISDITGSQSTIFPNGIIVSSTASFSNGNVTFNGGFVAGTSSFNGNVEMAAQLTLDGELLVTTDMAIFNGGLQSNALSSFTDALILDDTVTFNGVPTFKNNVIFNNGGGQITSGVSLTFSNAASKPFTIDNSWGKVEIDSPTIFGASVSGRINHTLIDYYTTLTCATQSEIDLYTYTLPANTLINNGDKLEIFYVGNVVGNGGVGQTTALRTYFGGQLINSHNISVSGVSLAWSHEIDYIRDGSNSMRFAIDRGYTNPILAGSASGFTFSNNNIIKITAQNSATGSFFTTTMGYIKFDPSAT